MVSVQEAKALLKQKISLSAIADVPLSDACGSILAAPVQALIDVPSFDNSAMDGYAFLYEPGRSIYEITLHIQAGQVVEKSVEPGCAARIFTGAPIPAGADTVIQQELVRVQDGKIYFDPGAALPGAHIRKRGSQCSQGQVIAGMGAPLTPGLIGLLASAGHYRVAIYPAPCVTLIITGNELQEPGSELQQGQIYNSNEPAITAYLMRCGIQKIRSRNVKDDADELNQAVKEGLAQSDLLLLTGGISAGEYDFVKQVLEKNGVEKLFYKVKQKPGKPVYAGSKDGKLVFALPGNPAAVITCFNQYVKPCILGSMGHTKIFEPDLCLPLAADCKKKEGLTFFVKAKYHANSVAVLPGQDSFNLLSFNEANCFAELEEAASILTAGSVIPVYYW